MKNTNIITFICPECCQKVSVSYENKDNSSDNFLSDRVPHVIADSIIGNTTYCPGCGDRFVVKFDNHATLVPLFLRKE